MRNVAITTVDNPFDPFNEFDKWFQFDESKGYQTSRMISRIAFTSSELSDADNTRSIEEAIDFVLEMFNSGQYKKLVRES